MNPVVSRRDFVRTSAAGIGSGTALGSLLSLGASLTPATAGAPDAAEPEPANASAAVSRSRAGADYLSCSGLRDLPKQFHFNRDLDLVTHDDATGF